MKYKFLQNAANGAVIFANPKNIRDTLTFTQGQSTLANDGFYTIRNTVKSLIDQLPWKSKDCTTDCPSRYVSDKVEVTFSGSPEHKDELIAQWTALKLNVDAAIANGMLDGFKPQHDSEFETIPEPAPGE